MMDGWEKKAHILPIKQIGYDIDHFMVRAVNFATGETEIVDPQKKISGFHRQATAKLRADFTGACLLRGIPVPAWKYGTHTGDQAVQTDQESCVLYTMVFMWQMYDTGFFPTEEQLIQKDMPQLLGYFTWALVDDHSLSD